MDERIEVGQWKLNVARWALIGMTETDREPEKDDLGHLLVLMDEINRGMAEAIEKAS